MNTRPWYVIVCFLFDENNVCYSVEKIPQVKKSPIEQIFSFHRGQIISFKSSSFALNTILSLLGANYFL